MSQKIGSSVSGSTEQAVRVAAGPVVLQGDLKIPEKAAGVVLFAHGSGSGRFSPRNRRVAADLNAAGLATLLVDLLSEEEEAVDRRTGHLRFDIDLLAERLLGATDWLMQEPRTASLPIGYFGASTGGGAALVAAARHVGRAGNPGTIAAVVSRGGRPDLAGEALPKVQAPTLLIVGGNDLPVIEMNRAALQRLGSAAKELVIVPGASHLFEEPGKLEDVSRLAASWFTRHFTKTSPGGMVHPKQV